jgi:hypothetical protein
MSHFAELDQNNIVTRVLVCDNSMPNEGYDWLLENLGGTWIQTSYNSTIRKNFAGIGYVYDPVKDAFIAPKPFESWILNDDSCKWEAPVAYPTDGFTYDWIESSQSWQLAEFQ